MIEAIQTMQKRGILVLSSIICGLESDTVDSLRAMRRFAIDSGSTLAQFTIYRPYPGTKDYFEMKQDRQHRLNKVENGYNPKHRTEILTDRFWLQPHNPVEWFRHSTMSSQELLRENQACWNSFYHWPEILKRARSEMTRSWSWSGRLVYIFLSIVFHRVYAGHGVSADSVQRKKGFATRLFIRLAIGAYNRLFRKGRVGFTVSRR
jgi:hypothetical protein